MDLDFDPVGFPYIWTLCSFIDIHLDETAPNGFEDEVKPTADTAVKASGGNADVQDKSAQVGYTFIVGAI